MKKQLAVYQLALSLALGITTTSAALAQQPELGTFTTIDFPGAVSTGGDGAVMGINPRGDIVGVYRIAGESVAHGYLLSRGEFTSFDFPDASFTSALGINARGDIVGNYSIDGVVFHGYLLSGGEFTTIDVPGASASFARGINRRGDIVGNYMSAGVTHGFLLSK